MQILRKYYKYYDGMEGPRGSLPHFPFAGGEGTAGQGDPPAQKGRKNRENNKREGYWATVSFSEEENMKNMIRVSGPQVTRYELRPFCVLSVYNILAGRKKCNTFL